MEIGRVVRARAGRDKDKYFVVVGIINESFVWIANGETRSIDSPKKKKVKHLEAKAELLDDIKEKIVSGKRVFDAELRKSLESLGYGNKEGDFACPNKM